MGFGARTTEMVDGARNGADLAGKMLSYRLGIDDGPYNTATYHVVSAAAEYRVNKALHRINPFSEGEPQCPPISVSIDVTTMCNLRCDGCYVYADEDPEWSYNARQDMTDEEWIARIEEVQEEHAHVIQATWVGGEPLLRWDLIEQGTDYFPVNEVVTNGTQPIPDREEYKNNIHFRLSLDGPREWHDNRRGDGVFDTALAHAAATTSPVQAHTVIDAYNMQDVDTLVDQVYDTGLDGIRFSYYTPQTWESGGRQLTPEQRDDVVEALQELKEAYEDFIDMTDREIELLGSDHQQDVFEDGCLLRRGASIPLGFDGERKEKCVMGPEADCGGCGCTVVPMTYAGIEEARADAFDTFI